MRHDEIVWSAVSNALVKWRFSPNDISLLSIAREMLSCEPSSDIASECPDWKQEGRKRYFDQYNYVTIHSVIFQELSKVGLL